ncbi:pectate lyase, partial [Duncaniella freteri]|uniref:pectate lyase n=1 Tax=Duncaniella freteri TaxID=2530391 RepID=UPI0025774672
MEAKRKNAEILNTDPEFFMTEEARRIGDQVILYQRVTGGWPKNIDMARPLDEKDAARVLDEKKRRNDSTTDNNATTIQMSYLARLYKATSDVKYRDAF